MPTNEAKTCPCGALIYRPQKIAQRDWENREYCNQSCVNTYRPREKIVHTKVCPAPECGKTFDAPRKNQECCSPTCAAQLKASKFKGQFRIDIPDKQCLLPECGQTYGRKPGEAAHRYRERKYCQRACTLKALSERAHGPLDSGKGKGKKGNTKRMLLPVIPVVSNGEPWRPPQPRLHPGRANVSDVTVVQPHTQASRTLRRAAFRDALSV